MNKGILITLPRHDDVTEYLSAFSKEIEQEASERGIKVKELKDGEAVKNIFEKSLINLDYSMIVFNGHGTEDSIKGYKDEIIVASELNENLLKERIVYARSCHAASSLGKLATLGTKNGCFIGYIVPFKFWANSLYAHNPLKDDLARIFLEPSNLIPISLIKGNSAKEASQNSKRRIIKNIKKILRNRTNESAFIAGDLWNNYVGQVLLGNQSATL